MKFNTSYNKIITDETLMETIQHGERDYPFHFYYDNLALYDFHCVEWHWHTEFEFVFVNSGTVFFGIGEKQFSLPAGSGVFINSRALHRYYSDEEAIVPNFVFMPDYIAVQNSLIYKKYILPVLSSSLDYQVFAPEIPWQAEVLAVMKEIIYVQEAESGIELITSSLVQRMWDLLYRNVNARPIRENNGSSIASQGRLQLMMQYIHQQFSMNISLEDIAGHAMVSKSTTLNLFRKYLHITPINYLINYRLQEAAKLLSSTERKIHVISKEVGFESVDYFCKAFKKCYSMTPTEYRKNRDRQ